VFGHPGAYLKHRGATFLDTLGVTYRAYSAVPPRMMKYPGFLTQLGLSVEQRTYQQSWTSAYRTLWRRTPLFRQWIYFALALVLLVVARKDRASVALLASGLVPELSLFFLAPSPDYRYSHWMIVVTSLVLAIVVARRRWTQAAPSR
jgi:hypothetical protein